VNDGSPIAKLGLGTAQFGLAYGVTNERGRVPESEVGPILADALAAGIDLVDTAAAYGDSEEVLGRALSPQSRVRIVSKLPPVPGDRIGDTEIEDCRAAVVRSLARLRRTSLDALLLHRPDDLRKAGGEKIVRLLSDLKETGTVAKIGISAYDRAQIDLSLERLPLDVVQVPVNLLDQRLLQDGTLDRLKRGNVEIHARSAFLQGVLLADPANLPAYFVPHLDRLRAVGTAAERAGLSRLALCLRFVLAQPAVDRVIVGVTSLAELRQIVDAATIAERLPDGLRALAGNASDLINPSRWRA
jgi:aryl-alcohol dehydrogenase-like predicted oxidoreductase